jgi:hypothetical protein
MKNFLVILLIITFSVSAFAQNNIDKLKNKNNLIDKREKSKDFTFNINTYLWALSLDGSTALPLNDASYPQTPVANVKLGFSDAVKYLKKAAMIKGAFYYKSYGFLYDVDYTKLEYNGSVPIESGILSAKVTAKQFTGDFSFGYIFPLRNKNIYLTGYAGTRVTSLDNTLDLLYESQSIFTTNKSKTWVDPIVGTDIVMNLAKHWFSYFKGDVGGFGVSSKFTSSALAGAGYKFSSNWNASLGLKYLYINYDKDYYLWKVNQYGLLISVGYLF